MDKIYTVVINTIVEFHSKLSAKVGPKKKICTVEKLPFICFNSFHAIWILWNPYERVSDLLLLI